MAFNPFEAFSMRSKLGRTLMAVLGIVVMLTFVLSTGAVGTGNDFFDQIGGVFASKQKGDLVATAYGDKVYQTDLSEVRRQRLAARTFLVQAREASMINWANELGEMAKGTQLTVKVREFVTAFAAARPGRMAGAAEARRYQMAANPQALQQLVRETKPDSDDRRALSAAAAIIVFDEQQLRFGGISPVLPEPDFNPESDDGALNFLLLLKKADQLGIQYSQKAVADLVARETGGRLTKKDNATIELNLRNAQQFGTFSGDWLIDAVGNEFRARAALATMQGYTASDEIRATAALAVQRIGGDADSRTLTTARPGGLTPFEFFEFYKDQCSEHTYAAIEVPASAFVAKVTGEPTPKERIELFNKHRTEVPDPARDRPGFKEPRKAAVSYVTLDANAKRITDAQPKVAAANQFLALSAAPMTFTGFGAGVAALAQAAHPELAATLAVQEEVRKRQEDGVKPYNLFDQFWFQPRDPSVYRPEVIAGLVAGFAGYPCPTATPVPYTLATRYMEVEEMKHRVPFLLQAWLMPFNPVSTNAFGFPAFALPHLQKPLPDGVYATMVAAEQKKTARRALFEADVAQLRTKLRDLTKDSNPLMAMFGPKDKSAKETKEKAAKGLAEARQYIASWLAERGLTAQGTGIPKSAMDLSKDPALKELNDVAFPEPDGTNSFVRQLFENMDFSQFGMGRQTPEVPKTNPFEPEWFPRAPFGDDLDKPAHLFWMTADVPAAQYSSLKAANDALAMENMYSFNGLLFRFDADRMTERVDKAWRLEKARGLARAEADTLAEKVKELGKKAATNPLGVEKEMRDLVAGTEYRVITLDGMAKLKFQHAPTQAAMNYGPPTIDRTKVLYPSADFADKLLEIRKQPVGAVTVVPDAPRTSYYVACLVSSTPKTVDQFRDVFTRTNAFGPAENPLYQAYALPEEQMDAARAVIVRLRTEAGVSLDPIKKDEGAAE